jgi:hypothetical protein
VDRHSAFCARAATSHGHVDGIAAATSAPNTQAQAGCGATRAAFCARSNAKSESTPSFAMAKHGFVKGLAVTILSVCKKKPWSANKIPDHGYAFKRRVLALAYKCTTNKVMFYSFRKVMSDCIYIILVFISTTINESMLDQAGLPVVGPHGAAALPRKVRIEVLSESIYVYFTDKTNINRESICFLNAARFTSRYISWYFITIKLKYPMHMNGDSSLTSHTRTHSPADARACACTALKTQIWKCKHETQCC